jgi:hypothetical protein
MDEPGVMASCQIQNLVPDGSSDPGRSLPALRLVDPKGQVLDWEIRSGLIRGFNPGFEGWIVRLVQ